MSQMNTGAGPGQQPAAGRPGQMTAVMRAMAQVSGPKVLRIGVVQAGRVVEERIIKQRTSVTIGPSEKAMFVVPVPSLPAQFRLFELTGGDYYLNFVDSMTGRVALATGISDLVALRGQAKRVGNAYQVKLTEEARGKIVVGEITFLFQFVAPPPVQPRPQLPLAVKGGLASQIDWNLTILAAFSFMIHFGVIGAMYSDWMDPVVNDDAAIQGLIDLAKAVPPPPIEEKKAEEKAVEKKAPEKKVEEAPKAAAAQAGAGKKTPISDKQAQAMAKEAQSIGMSLLAAFGGGSAVAGALNRGEIPPVDLSGAAASGAAVHAGANDLKLGTSGAPIAGGKGGGLGTLVASSGATGNAGAGSEAQKVAGPKADVSTAPASTFGGAVEGLEQTIAKLRTGFRSCYNKGLAQDPGMSGAVTVAIKISGNGEVESASPESNSGLSDDVVNCILRKVKNANFSPPAGGSTTVKIPIKFLQQK